MPTKEESAAKSRENGKKGGRPARKSADERTLRAYLDGKLNLEMEPSVDFLIDMRDGLILDSSPGDRRMAARDLLELAPAVQRGRAEIAANRDRAAGEAAQRTLKHVVDTEYEPPPGWSTEPGARSSDAHGADDEPADLEFTDIGDEPAADDPDDDEDDDAEDG